MATELARELLSLYDLDALQQLEKSCKQHVRRLAQNGAQDRKIMDALHNLAVSYHNIVVLATQELKPVYWTGEIGETDDFKQPYISVMYDGRTKRGPWACMTEHSWQQHGIGQLGTGYGQKYEKQADGRWLKVAG